jgi:Domain of unknown function (DUF4252)
MLTRIVPAALIAMGVSTSAIGQDYFEFDGIPGVDSPTVEIDLNAAMLAFLNEAAKAQGGDASLAIDGLDGIRVRVYEDIEDAAALAAFIEDSSGALERNGWQRAVYVTAATDKVRIYVKMTEQQVSGMTVMVVDDMEAVFINIAGTIDPAQLGRLAGAMGVDVLGSLQ